MYGAYELDDDDDEYFFFVVAVFVNAILRRTKVHPSFYFTNYGFMPFALRQIYAKHVKTDIEFWVLMPFAVLNFISLFLFLSFPLSIYVRMHTAGELLMPYFYNTYFQHLQHNLCLVRAQ